MAKCEALSSTLQALPVIGENLGAGASALGGAVQFLVSGVLNGDPAAMAAVALALIILIGVYQVTRIGASFLALFGFFVLALCSV